MCFVVVSKSLKLFFSLSRDLFSSGQDAGSASEVKFWRMRAKLQMCLVQWHQSAADQINDCRNACCQRVRWLPKGARCDSGLPGKSMPLYAVDHVHLCAIEMKDISCEVAGIDKCMFISTC